MSDMIDAYRWWLDWCWTFQLKCHYLQIFVRVRAVRHPRLQDSVLFSMDICDTYIPERLTKPSNIVIFFSVDHDCVFDHPYMCLSLLHDFPFVYANIFICIAIKMKNKTNATVGTVLKSNKYIRMHKGKIM